MTETLGDYSFLPWLRQGAGPVDRQAPTATRPSRCGRPRTSSSRSPASRQRGTTLEDVAAATSSSTAPATSSASTSGDRPHRAAALDHQLRAQLPRPRRVLRGGLPVALHAGRRRRRAAAAALDRAGRAGGHRRSGHLGVHATPRPSPTGRCPSSRCTTSRRSRRPTSSGPGPTCTSTGIWTAPGELVAADVPAAVRRVAERAAPPTPTSPTRGIVCPRRLKENTAYHAFLVPTFERGRLAGLGMDPDSAPFATASAWAELRRPARAEHMPYYHRWYFRTGGDGDFESLVRLLKWQHGRPPRRPPRHGRAGPGRNLPAHRRRRSGGVLRLGGALRAPLIDAQTRTGSPSARSTRSGPAPLAAPVPARSWPRFINLADDFTRTTALGGAHRRRRCRTVPSPTTSTR